MSMSLAYLRAKVLIDKGGHSSLHLKGQFIAQVRQNETGILSTGDKIIREVDNNKFKEIYEWFIQNNH